MDDVLRCSCTTRGDQEWGWTSTYEPRRWSSSATNHASRTCCWVYLHPLKRERVINNAGKKIKLSTWLCVLLWAFSSHRWWCASRGRGGSLQGDLFLHSDHDCSSTTQHVSSSSSPWGNARPCEAWWQQMQAHRQDLQKERERVNEMNWLRQKPTEKDKPAPLKRPFALLHA